MLVQLKDDFQTAQKIYMETRLIIAVETGNYPDAEKLKYKIRIVIDNEEIGEYILHYKTEKKRDAFVAELLVKVNGQE
jgi:hypothetical protein